MATLGTIERFVLAPVRAGGTASQAGTVQTWAMAASITIEPGDVLILSGGRVTVGNTDPAANTIVGVAVNKRTTTSTVGDATVVEVALALPGTLFVGSMVGSATTDYTAPAYTEVDGDLYGIVEESPTGFSVIDRSDTTTTRVRTAGFAAEQLRGLPLKTGSGGTLNPRVRFLFTSTIYGV